MPDRKTDISQVLDQTRQTLRGVLDHLQPADWEQSIQESDQQWTVRQIVAHLADSQKGMTTQIKRINAGEETVPPDFDVNRWNQRAVQKAAEKTPADLLKALDEDRAALKETLASLNDSDFDKSGRHGSLKIMTIEEILRLIGTHEAEHAQIIADKLKH